MLPDGLDLCFDDNLPGDGETLEALVGVTCVLGGLEFLPGVFGRTPFGVDTVRNRGDGAENNVAEEVVMDVVR